VAAERWGVSSGVPANALVALKNGWVPLAPGLWQIDSIGWVDGGGRDYVAAVLSTGNAREQNGIETVDTIVADLYAGPGVLTRLGLCRQRGLPGQHGRRTARAMLR
jgi:hypothetical protein